MPLGRLAEPCFYGFLQLRDDADGRQDRVLRSGSLRENHESARDLRAHGAHVSWRDGLPRDGNRPDALLRPPSAGCRRHRRVQDSASAVHRARTGLLQHDAETRPQGRGRNRVRGRLAAAHAGPERRESPQPAREPRGDRRFPRRDSPRFPVQQARSREHPHSRRAERHPEPGWRGGVVRGLGHERDGSLRNPQGDLEAHSSLAQGPDGSRAETSRRRRDRGDSRSPADDVVEGRRLRHRRGHRCDGHGVGGGHGSLLRPETASTRRSPGSSVFRRPPGSRPATSKRGIFPPTRRRRFPFPRKLRRSTPPITQPKTQPTR